MTPLDCTTVKDGLPELLAPDPQAPASATWSAAMQAHLDGCPACARERDLLVAAWLGLDRLPGLEGLQAGLAGGRHGGDPRRRRGASAEQVDRAPAPGAPGVGPAPGGGARLGALGRRGRPLRPRPRRGRLVGREPVAPRPGPAAAGRGHHRPGDRGPGDRGARSPLRELRSRSRGPRSSRRRSRRPRPPPRGTRSSTTWTWCWPSPSGRARSSAPPRRTTSSSARRSSSCRVTRS